MPVYDDEKLKDLEEISSAKALEAEHASDFSDAEKNELDQLSNKVGGEEGGLYKPEAPKKGLKGRVKAAKNAKMMWISGGIAAAVIGSVFALFSFLLPFKAFHITQMIEDKVGSVPEYAVDRRMEYYLNRFLILKTLENSGLNVADKNSPYTYLGPGAFSTLYVNWSGAKLDTKIQDTYKIRIVPEKNNDPKILGLRTSARPSGFRIEYLDQKDRLTGQPRTESLSHSEARQYIREVAKNETRSHQVFKRYHMRKVYKRYNGVDNWKPFERSRDNAREKYFNKKLAFKKYMVNQTIGRVSSRYTAYFNCMLEGAEKCRDQLNHDSATGSDSETRNATSELPEGESTDKNFLTKKLQDVGVKKILGGALAGIGILDTLSQINRAIESGALSYVVYDNVSKQYAGYSAGIRSASDQIRSGDDFDIEDARVLSETFDNFEQSPVYQAGFSGSKSGTASAAAEQIRRDCNGDGDTTDSGDLLKPGELVCPNKKALQDKEGIKDVPGYGAFSQLISAYDSTVGHVVGWVTSLASFALDKLAVDDAISKLAELSGVKDLLGGAFKSFMGYIVGFAITGAEEGPDAFDATLAGVLSADSQMGGAMGGPRDATVGGQYLSKAQVSQIQAEHQADVQYAASKRGFFERYFSPDNTDSLTSFAIIHTPSSVTSGTASFLSALNPFHIFGSISNNFTNHSSALPATTSTNPFGILQFGYATNSDVFTANGGDGMDSNELYSKYNCALPVNERPQNLAYGRPDGLPFDVPVQSDPCLLDQAVLDAGSRYFNNTYDEKSGSGTTVSSSSAGIDVANLGASSVSVPCASGTKDLGTVQSRYTGELARSGAPIIRLCQISSIPGQGNNTAGVEINGGAVVNSRVSAAWQALGEKAKAAGISLAANSSFRLADSCGGSGDGSSCATPGKSMHQLGIAIDFADMQVKGTSTTDCAARATVFPSKAWTWLYSNAEQFGIKQYTYEAWHWDPAPLANRCGASS